MKSLKTEKKSLRASFKGVGVSACVTETIFEVQFHWNHLSKEFIYLLVSITTRELSFIIMLKDIVIIKIGLTI